MSIAPRHVSTEASSRMSCQAGEPPPSKAAALSLPVVSARTTTVRRSTMSRWRAGVLIAVHLLIVAHVLHWVWAGRTLSPVEPSEAMYALNQGYINAGLIFFALAILATLIFGRFVCGWGCHFVAYQDLCTWLLGRIGIKPRPLRARLLIFAPLALALYMFVWPTAYRWWTGGPWPSPTNHLLTSDFWQTFPGPIIAVLTIAVAGFAIVYFLGSKGFCTYACPYGGFFGVADRVAPGRILVTDACEHCGHCTAACGSNVRVHEEVARYGMVVDPGCMKCMDCVSVCPNDALHFGFARPPLGARPAAPKGRQARDFTLSEELVMIGVGLAALVSLRGLYDLVPLLFAMGLAAITAFLVMKLWRLARNPNVRFQNLSLRRGGRVSRAGVAFTVFVLFWIALVTHSGFVQFNTQRGRSAAAALALGDDVWRIGSTWWETASSDEQAKWTRADEFLQRADRWGLVPTRSVLQDRLWLLVAAGRVEQAEHVVRRVIAMAPGEPEPHRGLGNVLRKAGRPRDAEDAFRAALLADPAHAPSREDLIAMLMAQNRFEQARAEARAGVEHESTPASRLRLARVLMDTGRFSEAARELEPLTVDQPGSVDARMLLGISRVNLGDASRGLDSLRRAVALDTLRPDAHYNLGMALLSSGATDEAVTHLQQAAKLAPHLPLYHYNLGVATFMAGRPVEALPHIEQSLRLNPDDPQARGFADMVRQEITQPR